MALLPFLFLLFLVCFFRDIGTETWPVVRAIGLGCLRRGKKMLRFPRSVVSVFGRSQFAAPRRLFAKQAQEDGKERRKRFCRNACTHVRPGVVGAHSNRLFDSLISLQVQMQRCRSIAKKKLNGGRSKSCVPSPTWKSELPRRSRRRVSS